MQLNPLESGVEPHQLQHFHIHPWECGDSLGVFRQSFLRYLIQDYAGVPLPSLDLLLVGLRCGKWLHKIWLHRLGESGVSAETLLAPTLCCCSQVTLLVSSPRTLHEGAVAHKSGEVQSLCALLVFCCAVLEQQVSFWELSFLWQTVELHVWTCFSC